MASAGPRPHPEGVGLVAALGSGLLASILSVWAIAERACLTTEAHLGVKAILKFGVGRVIALIVAGVLATVTIAAGVSAIPGPQFVEVAALGAIFGFSESLLLSMTYRISFRRTPVWPIYVWPVAVHTVACALGAGLFVWFEDLGRGMNCTVAFGLTTFDLRTPLLLVILGIIASTRVAIFSRVTKQTEPE